ncbi:hypothetical protein C8R44DRAFT_744242 [Mycena epipterygia]|nr:hypothetical protein C8R44DRAFT_744242 [Mycena epipterygia]
MELQISKLVVSGVSNCCGKMPISLQHLGICNNSTCTFGCGIFYCEQAEESGKVACWGAHEVRGSALCSSSSVVVTDGPQFVIAPCATQAAAANGSDFFFDAALPIGFFLAIEKEYMCHINEPKTHNFTKAVSKKSTICTLSAILDTADV